MINLKEICLNKEFGLELIINNKKDLIKKSFVESIIQKLVNSHVILIKNFNLTTKEFIRFSNLFGNISPHDLLQYRHPDYPQLSYVTNIDKNGNIDKWGSTKRAADWHSDGSFRELPYSFTVLHSIEAPKTGGMTEFTNMINAYNDLDLNTKKKINELKALHKRGEGWRAEKQPDLTKKQKDSGDFDGQVHPLIIQNPISKLKTYYANPVHTHSLIGMSKDESNTILDKLHFHSINKKYMLTHKWEKGETHKYNKKLIFLMI